MLQLPSPRPPEAHPGITSQRAKVPSQSVACLPAVRSMVSLYYHRYKAQHPSSVVFQPPA